MSKEDKAARKAAKAEKRAREAAAATEADEDKAARKAAKKAKKKAAAAEANTDTDIAPVTRGGLWGTPDDNPSAQLEQRRAAVLEQLRLGDPR